MCLCVVFTLSRYFYPTTPVHPQSVLILHSREIQILGSQTVKQSKPVAIHQFKASEILAHRVQEHNQTSRALQKREKKNEIRKILKAKSQRRKENKAKKTTGYRRCDARASERNGRASIARGTPCVLKRNRYLLHRQNNTKKPTATTAVARKKQTQRR